MAQRRTVLRPENEKERVSGCRSHVFYRCGVLSALCGGQSCSTSAFLPLALSCERYRVSKTEPPRPSLPFPVTPSRVGVWRGHWAAGGKSSPRTEEQPYQNSPHHRSPTRFAHAATNPLLCERSHRDSALKKYNPAQLDTKCFVYLYPSRRRARAPRAPGPVGEREPLDAAKHGEDTRDVDAAHSEVTRGDVA